MPLLSGIIGIDESGKGDFFGPLVVSGCFVTTKDETVLADLGVRDSKKIVESTLIRIDEQLRQRCTYVTVIYHPTDYNRLYGKIKNLNILLAQGHASAISQLLSKVKESSQVVSKAISDKFGKEERLETALKDLSCDLTVEQIVRGESKIPVAAASIIARAEFMRQMDQLSAKYKMTIPRGAAAHVDRAGQQMVALYGSEVLAKTAKLHFKNYQRAMKLKLSL